MNTAFILQFLGMIGIFFVGMALVVVIGAVINSPIDREAEDLEQKKWIEQYLKRKDEQRDRRNKTKA